MIENSPLSKSTVIIGTGKIIKAAVAGKIKIAAIFSGKLYLEYSDSKLIV